MRLQNNEALKQIPFVGKKTVPRALRKDMWQPLATLYFPQPFQGLLAYHKLREYKRLHEYAYPISTIRTDPDDPLSPLLERKKRARVLMDQKANAIADMAAVLKAQQEEAEGKWSRKRKYKFDKRLSKQTIGWPRIESLNGVGIDWRNLDDANYAKEWPNAVCHGVMFKFDLENKEQNLWALQRYKKYRHNAPLPPENFYLKPPPEKPAEEITEEETKLLNDEKERQLLRTREGQPSIDFVLAWHARRNQRLEGYIADESEVSVQSEELNKAEEPSKRSWLRRLFQGDS